MSVPGFLLALVLGVLADVEGLFSPEYAGAGRLDVGQVPGPAAAHLGADRGDGRDGHGGHDPHHAREPAG
jgi:hypothetical protein